MDDLKLITLVQQNELLYNKHVPEYKSIEKKKAAWYMISREVGYCPEDCMRRWTSLRDRFVREKRLDMENQASGNSPITEARYRWPLVEALEFISPFIIQRGKRSWKKIKEEDLTLPYIVEMKHQPTIESMVSYSPIPSPPSTQTLLQPIMQQPLIHQPALEIQQSPQRSITPEPEEYILQPEVSLNSHSRKRKKCSEDTTEADKLFSEAVQTFKNVCKAREQKASQLEQDQKDENIALQSFGKMILATIGSMSCMNQAKAMTEVTEVVMRIKMESHNSKFNDIQSFNSSEGH